MKYIFFLATIIFISCSNASLKIDPKEIVGIPVRIGNIEITQNDFPDEMNWYDSEMMCKSLGEGWRMPNQEEIHAIYQMKNKIPGLSHSTYWSSTEATWLFDAWTHNFIDGNQSTTLFNKYTEHFAVRAVRLIK